MPKMGVSYEFDMLEDRTWIRSIVNADNYRDCLIDLDMKLRNTLKHDDAEWLNSDGYEYLEGLREIIQESGALDCD